MACKARQSLLEGIRRHLCGFLERMSVVADLGLLETRCFVADFGFSRRDKRRKGAAPF